MKTLVNKQNPEIRITAPEITTEATPYGNYQYVYWIPAINQMYNPIDWTLVEEEPEVDLEKEIKKHTDLFHADIEYPLRLTAIKFYELGKRGGSK